MRNLAVKNNHITWRRGRRSEILILDDSEFDRARLKKYLSQLTGSLNITEAADLTSFERLAREKRYDLVFVDYTLPDCDGLEALQAWNAVANTDHAYLVMITGYDNTSLAVRALQAGFDDYLSKDLIRTEVLETLISASAQKKIERSPEMGFLRPRSPDSTVRGLRTAGLLNGFNLKTAFDGPLREALCKAVACVREERLKDTLRASLEGDDVCFVFRPEPEVLRVDE
ncbi:MAG: response regulator [Pseudomonadota bacterium]